MTTVVAFFNNKGGVGKTSLVYHLTWMYADLGLKVLAADVDPQANLTAAFVDDDGLEALWPEEGRHSRTLYGAVEPLLRGVGDAVEDPQVEEIDEGISLLAGDLALARFEDELSQQWPRCLDGQERAFRVISAFWRVIQSAAEQMSADLAILDLGPNLGAINRAALIASDYLVVPLAPDLFSLQGLKNLGPTVGAWRDGWHQRLSLSPLPDLRLPEGRIEPAGYVVLQHAVRLDRPTRAYDRWAQRIPDVYARHVAQSGAPASLEFSADPNCLALLKHYRSLMPMAQEARKPIFHLRAADGAIGAHFSAVLDARRDFERLARVIAERCSVPLLAPA